jgi:DNA-binding transcriptional LysR family regulator
LRGAICHHEPDYRKKICEKPVVVTVEQSMGDRTDCASVAEAPVHRLNLNMLYPLDAILHASTLTEAGRRVRLSQSAMSHALRRLREHFGDDLVTHAGGEQHLTALGLALRGEVRRVLLDVDGTFNFALSFDPLTSTDTITVAATESFEQMVRPVLRNLSAAAPGVGRHDGARRQGATTRDRAGGRSAAAAVGSRDSGAQYASDHEGPGRMHDMGPASGTGRMQ